MASLSLVGEILDQDGTAPGDEYHPAPVLLVETCGIVNWIILPATATAPDLALLRPGRLIKVLGEVRSISAARGAIVVAREVRFAEPLH